MKKKILALSLLALAPSVALAATTDVSYFTGLIEDIGGLFNSLVPVIIAAAVVYFLWGVLQFVGSGDDEEKRKAGRSRMLHGIIAIFIMVSLWGIIAFLTGVFDIDPGASPYVPQEVPI